MGRPSVRARDQRGQALDWESGGAGWRPGRAPRGGRRAGSDPRPLVREHGAFPSLTLQSGSLLPRSWRLPRDGSTQLLATEARFCLVAAALGVRSRAGTCGRLPAPCAALPAAGFPTTCFAGVFPPQLAPWWGPHSALQPTRGTLGRDSLDLLETALPSSLFRTASALTCGCLRSRIWGLPCYPNQAVGLVSGLSLVILVGARLGSCFPR